MWQKDGSTGGPYIFCHGFSVPVPFSPHAQKGMLPVFHFRLVGNSPLMQLFYWQVLLLHSMLLKSIVKYWRDLPIDDTDFLLMTCMSSVTI